jgi:hypothetical protein
MSSCVDVDPVGFEVLDELELTEPVVLEEFKMIMFSGPSTSARNTTPPLASRTAGASRLTRGN